MRQALQRARYGNTGPTCSGHGNPVIRAVRKTSIEVFRLNRIRDFFRLTAFRALRETRQQTPLVLIGLGSMDLREHPPGEFGSQCGIRMDFVITVCNSANETCPAFPGDVKRLHWPFDDRQP